MPNWIEGTMKLRGKAEDLIRFVDNGLDGNVNKEDGPDYASYYIGEYIYVNDSRRAFTDRDFYLDISKKSEKNQVVTIPIKQAWSFTPYEGAEQRWIDLGKKYNLDIRLQGFECGLQFYQDVEIVNGVLVRNDEKQYADWDWECPMPRLGG
jgi:hypothetical protein